jgi:hypothetical protein
MPVTQEMEDQSTMKKLMDGDKDNMDHTGVAIGDQGGILVMEIEGDYETDNAPQVPD